MIRTATEADGQLERITLARPKANVLDAAMVGAIRGHVDGLRLRPELKLLVFDAEGPHFSFGASVEEHLPGRVAAMLTGFHDLFRAIEDLGVPTAALVRGQCLGGGCELAIACGSVFCDDTARFALPEVKLGVFPPLGAALLPWRIGGARAARLIATGATVDADEAVRIGLADAVGDPEVLLREAFEDLAPRSAVAVRFAWRAARRPVRRVLDDDLPALERLYLDELMTRRDPAEGLTAFLERREPRWEHR